MLASPVRNVQSLRLAEMEQFSPTYGLPNTTLNLIGKGEAVIMSIHSACLLSICSVLSNFCRMLIRGELQFLLTVQLGSTNHLAIPRRLWVWKSTLSHDYQVITPTLEGPRSASSIDIIQPFVSIATKRIQQKLEGPQAHYQTQLTKIWMVILDCMGDS